MPTRWWFAGHPITGEDIIAQRRAKAICDQCPVAVDCLAEAVVRGEGYGLWAGCSPKVVGRLRRRTNSPTSGWRIAEPTVQVQKPRADRPEVSEPTVHPMACAGTAA
jgi:hypothetical protein